MKLKLRDFYEMSKLVSPFPVDLAFPLLKKLVKGFDAISYDEDMDSDQVCESLKWIGLLKDNEIIFKMEKEDVKKLADSFDEDKKLVVGEWLIKLIRTS